MSAHRSIVDRLAPHLPFGFESVYVSLWLQSRPVAPKVDRLIPWVMLFVERQGCSVAVRLFRLPGAKLVELWDPQRDEWLVGSSK